MDPSAPLESKTTFLLQCAMGVLVLGLQMALNTFGQEREAFMNLLVAPMDTSQLLKAKAAYALVPALLAFVALSSLVSFITPIDIKSVIAVMPLGFTILVAVVSVELAVGARYAMFTSGGRSRFVTQEGTIVGLLLCMATIGVSMSPLALHYILGYVGIPIAFLLTLALTLIVAGVGMRVAHGELNKLYEYNY